MNRIAVIVVAVAVLGRGAAGQPDDVGAPEARRLFDDARALLDQGKPAEACELFRNSYDLERAAGTMLNLGECAERDGKYRRAWLLYDAAAQEFDRTHKPTRAKFARDRAAALAPKLATIRVRVAEPRLRGLTVRIGDHAAPPAAEIVERLDVGPVAIVASAPGHEPFKTTAFGEPNRELVVEVPALRDRGALGPVGKPLPVDSPRGSRRKRSRLYLAAGLGGAGVIGLAISGVVGLAANRAYDEPFAAGDCTEASPRPLCNQAGADQLRDAGKTADLATGVAVAGGILVAAGAVVFVTAPRETVVVAPTATHGALGLAVTGRF